MERTATVGPLTLMAALLPNTCDEDKRTADLVLAAGTPVLRSNWLDGPYYEQLAIDPKSVRLDRLNNGAPLLNSHIASNLDAVLGVVERAAIEKGQLVGTVRFAREDADPHAELIWRKVRDGIIRNVSVGYRAYKMEKQRGGETTIPLFRVVDWEPFEVSLVPMGADVNAKVRADVTTHTCQVVVPDEPKEVSMAEQTANASNQTNTNVTTQTVTVPIVNAAEPPPAVEPVATQDAPKTPILMVADAPSPDELARRDDIMDACDAAGLSLAFARSLINDKVSLVDAQRRIIEQLRTAAGDAEGPTNTPHGITIATASTMGADLDIRARSHMAKTGVSYREALRVAQRENPIVAKAFADHLQRR